MTYESSAGLGVRNHYGPKVINEGSKFGGQVSTSGKTITAEWVFSYDDLPALVAQGGMETHIPAGSVIHRASIQAIEAFTGGTSYDIGLQQKDGTEIDADGLWDLLAIASLSAVDEMSIAAEHAGTNSGTLVLDKVVSTDVADSKQPLASDGYLVVTAAGTFTAGKARVLIEYTPARKDQSGNYTAGGVSAATA